MISIRELIIRKIKLKVEEISKAFGYHFDILNVERGRVSWSAENELPALSIMPGVEDSIRRSGVRVCSMPVEFRYFKTITHNHNSSEIGEKMLADLTINIVGTIFTMSFTNGSNAIAAGDEIVGVTSGARAYVTRISGLTGSWGAGTAAGTLTIRYVRGTFQSETIKVGSVNSAQITGALTKKDDVFTEHVNDVIYTNGGIESYPDAGEGVVEVVARFTFDYTTKVDNPYE